MSMIRLASYGGTAEILGQVKEVYYSTRTLSIRDISLYEANQIINLLATNHVAGVQPRSEDIQAATEILTRVSKEPEPEAKQEPETKQEPPPAQKAEAAPKVSDKESPQNEPPARRRPGRPRKPREQEREEPTSSTDNFVGEPESEPEAIAQKSVDEDEGGWVSGKDEPAPNGVAGVDAELLANLKKRGKIRDIVGLLVEAGFNTQNKLVTICEQLKDDVPVINRIGDLRGRIQMVATSVGVEA